jgi:predicted nucleotidyltransferase
LSSSQIIAKKRKALNSFSRNLLSSQEGKNVGKIILFGSLVRGDVRDGSDVDVLILASGNLNEEENAAADAAFEAGLEFGESVEPLVYCLDEARYPSSFFLYNVSRKGEEIYSMNEAKING